ncbi:MAG: hypothetical protein HY959_01820 [Ignavibacteriae bacterium]|nr:hypothetical protein [Ignavibacteriota bacterium]
MKKILIPVLLLFVSLSFYSCSENAVNVINDIVSNKVTAKDRLDSAFAQAQRKYSSSVKLVMIFGKNVLFEGTDVGKTDITGLTILSDPNNIGAWLYIFKKPGTDTLAVYTPNPTPGARDCIELTALFSFNTVINLISDTSARNIVSGALSMINNTNFFISTSSNEIVNSDVAYGYSYSSNPTIKFNSSYIPVSSSNNGQSFFATGTNKTVNMFLIPALGTLNLPAYISGLINFPNDLWVVNYKRTNNSVVENFIEATVTKSSQNMTINIPPAFTSKVINLSKY